MIYLWIVGVLAVIAAICGLIAGSASERVKLKQNFLWLALIGVAMALVLVAVTYYQSGWIKEVIGYCVQKKYPGLVGDPQFGMVYNIDSIPGIVLCGVSGLALMAVWAVGWSSFNCRSMVKSWWSALIWNIGGLFVLYHLFFWGLQGVGVGIILFGRFCYTYPTGAAFAVTLFLTAALLIAWTWYCLWGERRGWRVLLVQLGIVAGVYLLCWLAALAAAAGLAQSVKSQAVKDGIAACQILEKSSPEISVENQKIGDFHKQHPLFELPVSSVYDWKSANNNDKNLVPAAAREYTLRLFDSPEALEYYQSFETIADAEIPPNTLVFPLLNHFRALTRICAGRAALYLETGEPDKVLPQLMKFIRYDREKIAGKPYMINELVRIACRTIWYHYLVSLGPDGPQYAPEYRRALDYLKEQKMYLPDEAGVALGNFQKISAGSYTELLTLPSMLAASAKMLSYLLFIRPELQKMENDGYHGQALPWDHLNIYRNLAVKSEVSLLLGRTGVALKLYRSEEGTYPATLDELVPKYLDQLPVSPFPDAPLIYRLDGNDFTLSIKVPPSQRPFEVSSQQRY